MVANAISVAEGLEHCYALIDCQGSPGFGLECNELEVTAPSGSSYDCEGYRLATEAEWEYAGHAGEEYVYSGSDTVDDVAWYDTNSEGELQPVRELQPNAWGLYDLSGNVTEWVWDRYDEGWYSTGENIDPEGPPTGESRVQRGGGYSMSADLVRLASRRSAAIDAWPSFVGVRLARTAP